MIDRKALTIADVQKIAAAAEAEAKRNNWNVSIAICDDGGHLLHFQRLDGAGTQTTYISQGKAKAAAFARKPTKSLEDIVAGGRNAFLSVPDLVLLEGGEPIIVDGVCIGGVGVSGVKSSDDALIAQAGIKALLG
ncbi:heme-binding protein [Ferrovibrio sp.]|uniref:GlcG/HbpS family heme-binding protein n=1 Tax=Ferrovibrio sp. TaxID=1917215 RepID=UPI0025C20AB1|nr:heme-binding protein [Ferrovibrio sp.]MBX3456665.1 heme-binding protein [Ferrovibrio sp.]